MSWTRKKVLLAVKAYPTKSKRHGVSWCAAGITEEGEWIRMYPMSFHEYMRRRIPRYSWIEFEGKRDKGDKLGRKECYKVREGSVRIVDLSLTSKGRAVDWETRNELILTLENPSVSSLEKLYQYDKTSLGLIKPKQVHDFVIEPPENEAEEDGSLLFQTNLQGNIVPTPDPFPTAKYKFTCLAPDCSEHNMTCLDWELGQAWRKWKPTYVDQQTLIGKLKEKFLDYMTEKRELYFYLGMHSQFPSWMIIGIYYPPKGSG